jgi:hypothetical protein
MGNAFLDELFGGQEGIIYAPVKGETWEQHFFAWPQERPQLERHIENYDRRDVYLSPVLFSERKVTPRILQGI